MDTLGRHAWAELADKLADMIIDGRLQPGQHLVEADVAEQFGISRGPVRTALAALERQGLAEPKGRRGLAVVQMTEQDVQELFEVRRALETTALQRVVERVGSIDFSPLKQRLDRLTAASADGVHEVADIARMDVEFHRGICELSGNGRLRRMWDTLNAQILLVMGTLQGGAIGEVKHLFDDHRLVYEALVSDDPKKAVVALDRHLSVSCSFMVEAIRAARTQEHVSA